MPSERLRRERVRVVNLRRNREPHAITRRALDAARPQLRHLQRRQRPAAAAAAGGRRAAARMHTFTSRSRPTNCLRWTRIVERLARGGADDVVGLRMEPVAAHASRICRPGRQPRFRLRQRGGVAALRAHAPERRRDRALARRRAQHRSSSSDAAAAGGSPASRDLRRRRRESAPSTRPAPATPSTAVFSSRLLRRPPAARVPAGRQLRRRAVDARARRHRGAAAARASCHEGRAVKISVIGGAGVRDAAAGPAA